jgi:alkylation response protein AidB-like acyl-CoA dehydrogenase
MAGYSQTPLVKKLGLRSGMRLQVISAPMDYAAMVEDLPAGLQWAADEETGLDFIHLFDSSRAGLEETLPRLVPRLAKIGVLWISWPKKSGGMASDLDENIIRETGLKNGMVDVKVCAVNEQWSGLKFVFRLKDRHL